MPATPGRAIGLVAGVALDALVGEPRRFHPVAGFGRAAAAVERRLYADSRSRGALFTGLCVAGVTGLGLAIERSNPRGGVLNAAAVAAATWTVVGSHMLAAEGEAIARLVVAGELDAARRRLPNLVGRDPSQLDEVGICRAATESIAENTSDAVIAPLLAGALFGVPGLLGYRAINTLDAMVGHRNLRYRRFGWASARLDDLANLIPARVTATLVALLSLRPAETWRITRRFARRHPSPNAGWCEAGYAAALELRLGGQNNYAGRIEDRPILGTGRTPQATDLALAARLLRRVTVLGAATAAGVALTRSARRAAHGSGRRASRLIS